ncbi:TetR/AcrR family transcriptional regulator [Brevibacillus ruminantium]|uniref:TetR/AcrR family transcriptional regulator n=1 Tax=Brevibacillus ruminantium TaxID=2950604 RepID=A0ABY4WL56_9BACL|nr:TetR/AcrR family transcriptional regulator [Brevibacillus ruminantium]USG66797.1 TetR/AcrR family transcriptional regulator [Brevibacillus ruminantium]
MKQPSKAEKAEAKRAFLVEQATRCLAERGYASVSLRDIARESGVSLGILHYYFESKEDLLLAVITGYKHHFLDELETELLADPLEGWQTRFSSLLRQALTEHRNTHRLWYDLQVQAMYHPAFRKPVQEIRERLYSLIRHMLEKLLNHHGKHAASFSPETWVPLFYSALDGLFFQSLMADKELADQLVARLEEDLTRLLETFFIHSTLN